MGIINFRSSSSLSSKSLISFTLMHKYNFVLLVLGMFSCIAHSGTKSQVFAYFNIVSKPGDIINLQ